MPFLSHFEAYFRVNACRQSQYQQQGADVTLRVAKARVVTISRLLGEMGG